MNTLLVESTAVPVKSASGRWKAVLITPGQGASGFYSEDMLREYGPVALRKGAKSFVTHNREQNGEPDPFKMWGVLAEDSYYEEGVGLVGEIEVLKSWQERVDEVAPHTALSVYVAGERDDAGNITVLHPDAQNGVDMVVYPGREGSGLIEKLAEAMAKANGPASADADQKEGESNMEELKALLEALSAQVSGLEEKVDSIVTLSESAAAVDAEKADAFQVADEITEAIAEAGLPAQGRKRVIESVKAGAEVADAVKAESDYVAAIAEAFKSEPAATGRVVEGVENKFSLAKIAEAK